MEAKEIWKNSIEFENFERCFSRIKYKTRMRGLFYASLMRVSFCVLTCFSVGLGCGLGMGLGTHPPGFAPLRGTRGKNRPVFRRTAFSIPHVENISYSSRRRMASQPSTSQCSSSPGSCMVLPLHSSRQVMPVGRPARWQERERISFFCPQ